MAVKSKKVNDNLATSPTVEVLLCAFQGAPRRFVCLRVFFALSICLLFFTSGVSKVKLLTLTDFALWDNSTRQLSS